MVMLCKILELVNFIKVSNVFKMVLNKILMKVRKMV